MSDPTALASARSGQRHTPRGAKFWVRREDATDDEVIGVRVHQGAQGTVGDLKQALLPHVSLGAPGLPDDAVSAADVELLLNGGSEALGDSLPLAPHSQGTFVARASGSRARRPSLASSQLERSAHYEARADLRPVPHASSSLLQKALQAVKGSSDWHIQFDGLTTLRRLAVHHPALLTHSLNSVLLAVAGAMQSLRSAVQKNALLTVQDVATGELRQTKALDGQLDPLVTEIIRLASGDVGMLRAAAEECCQSLISSVTDAQRLKIVNSLLSQATTAKNHHLRAQSVRFITATVAALAPGEIRNYPRMPLFLKALESFVHDANEQCRANARELGAALCQSLGGRDEMARLLHEHLKPEQVDALQSALRSAGSPPLGSSPRRGVASGRSAPSPQRSQARARSPSPSNPLPAAGELLASPPRNPSAASLLSAGGRHSRGTNGSRARPVHLDAGRCASPLPPTHPAGGSPGHPSHGQKDPQADSPARARACKGFQPGWGTPGVCGRCKQHRSAHGASAGGGGGGVAGGGSHDWETCSVASRRSNTSRVSRGSGVSRGATQQGRAQAAGTPHRARDAGATPHIRRSSGVSAGSTARPPAPRRTPSRHSAWDAASAVSAHDTVDPEFHRMIERQKAELTEKDEMIMKLLKENFKLKRELDDSERIQVSTITLLTTPEFEARDRSAAETAPSDGPGAAGLAAAEAAAARGSDGGHPAAGSSGRSDSPHPDDLRALEEIEAVAEALAAAEAAGTSASG